MVLALPGCAGLPPRPPSAVSQCAVIASLRVQHVLAWTGYRYRADQAYLVQVDDSGKLDLDRPIASSYEREGQLYFLDLPPGRYAPVRLSFRAHGLRLAARIDPRQSLQAAVTARPGQVIFLGELVLQRLWEGGVSFLANGLRSAAWLLPPWRRSVVPIVASFKFNDRSGRMETQALQAARRHLFGSGWAAAIDARLQEINLPPPPPVEGFFSKRPLPEIETSLFSYVDALQWGKPAQVGSGYEWRRPKGAARIHLSLVTEGEPGALPLAAFLRRLKEQGSPEDSHSLSEVVLSSGPAWAARYTTYHYPQPYLTGSRVEVSVTETLVAPEPQGYFVLRFRSSRDEFDLVHAEFLRFRALLKLKRRRPKAEGL